MANPFVHVELQTHDLAKAKEFYRQLFDWKLEPVPQMDYTMIQVGEGTGGGMWESKEMKSHWLAYVVVDDVNAATRKAQCSAPPSMKGTTEVPGMGWFSIIVDPTGAALGLWQSRK